MLANKESYLRLFDYITNSICLHYEIENAKNKVPSEIAEDFDLDFLTIKETPSGRRYSIPLQKMEIKNKNTEHKLIFLFTPSGVLFSERYLDVRQEIIRNNFSGIVTTKKNFFNQRTSAAFAFIIIDGSNSSKKYFSTVDNINDLYNIIFDQNNSKRKIYRTENITEKNLSPEHYAEPTSTANFISKYGTRKLGDIADVINGASISKASCTTKGVPVIFSSDIKDDGSISPSHFIDDETCKKFAKQLLQEGDILVTKFFGQNKIVCIHENNLPLVASSMFAIIRPDSDINDVALFQYFQSNIGKVLFREQLDNFSTGNTFRSINLTNLKAIEVPAIGLSELYSVDNQFSASLQTSIAETLSYLDELKTKQTVLEELKSVGWQDYELKQDFSLTIGKDSFSFPITLLEKDNCVLAVIVLKFDTKTKRLLKTLINNIESTFLFIYTFGTYYEIYKKTYKGIFVHKFFRPPTKQDLINIIQKR